VTNRVWGGEGVRARLSQSPVVGGSRAHRNTHGWRLSLTLTKLTEILQQAALYLEYTSVTAHNMANRFQLENQPDKKKTPSEKALILLVIVLSLSV